MKPNVPKDAARNEAAGKEPRTDKVWQIWKGNNLFQLLEQNLAFALFLSAIGFVYIWNAHFAEKQAREVDNMRKELKELKSECMTLNAHKSKLQKQTQIQKKAEDLKLRPLEQPPYKLVVENE